MRITIWDLPVRLCHWLLALSIAGAFISVNMGEMEWHMRFGFAAGVLVVFRLIWGLIGSETARFTRFIPGPGSIVSYLRGTWRGLGHNPLGALSVLAMLAAVIFQVATGTMSNDDILFDGPWAVRVGKDTSDMMTGWHTTSRWVLLGLIGLHILAVAVYTFLLKKPLVRAMITGKMDAGKTDAGEAVPEGGVRAPRMRHPLVAVPVLAVAIAVTAIGFRYWLA